MKAYLRRALLVLCSVLVALAAAEIFCRVASIPFSGEATPSENAIARFDPEIGWSYIPHHSAEVWVSETVPNATYHFDGRGIRVPDPATRLDPARPSLLLVGGSFAMGHGVSYEHSLAGYLASFEDVPYQIVNLGVQAYGTDQSLLQLRRHIDHFDTKLVIYVFLDGHGPRNANYDRRLLFPDLAFLGTKPLFALDAEGRLYIDREPRLYEDYRTSYLLSLLRLSLDPPDSLALTHALILEMQRLAASRGAGFSMLLWPTESTRGPYRDLGADLIDVEDRIPHGFAEMVADYHPDSEAHRHVALALREDLRERGYTTSPTPTPDDDWRR